MGHGNGVLGGGSDLVEQGDGLLLTGDVQPPRRSRGLAERRVDLPEELAGLLVAVGARQVPDALLALGVGVVEAPGQRESGGVLLHQAPRVAPPQRGAVRRDREDPVGLFGGVRGDEIAGQIRVGEYDAFGDGARQRPHVVLARRGEDRQTVLGVVEVDLRERQIQLLDDVLAALRGHRGIGLQLLRRTGQQIAQPDGVLRVVRLAPVRGQEDRHRRIVPGPAAAT